MFTKIEAIIHAHTNCLAFHNLWIEIGTFYCVLENGGDPDAFIPVQIVEALGEYQLLKMSLFEIASVGVDYFIVGWDDGSFDGLLTDNVEALALADDWRVDNSAWWNIFNFPSGYSKEFLAVLKIDHDDCDFHLEIFVFWTNMFLNFLCEIVFYEINLIIRDSQNEDNEFFWRGIVSVFYSR